MHGHQVRAFEHVLAKLSNRQARAVQRNRRDDRIDPAAIGHARVDHRRGLIEPSPQRRQNALHDPLDVVVVDKAQFALVQDAVALDKHPVRAIDQNFGDRRIAQQDFQRAKAGELVNDFLGQPFHFIA